MIHSCERRCIARDRTTLPLISLGGSSVMAVGLAFGMMLTVSRALEEERLYTMELTEKEKKYWLPDETERGT